MRYEAHGFAGLGYPFTAGGIRALEKLIDAVPVEAESHGWRDAEYIAKQIVYRIEKYDDEPVIIFFAHSYGVKTGLEACWYLHARGIPVRYFAAIDPTALPVGSPPMTCPPNVQQLDEFWSERGWVFNWPLMARKSDPLGGKGGMVRNPHRVPHWLMKIAAGHSATASHPITQARIVEQVERIAG